jgi:hypothetical protein
LTLARCRPLELLLRFQDLQRVELCRLLHCHLLLRLHLLQLHLLLRRRRSRRRRRRRRHCHRRRWYWVGRHLLLRGRMLRCQRWVPRVLIAQVRLKVGHRARLLALVLRSLLVLLAVLWGAGARALRRLGLGLLLLDLLQRFALFRRLLEPGLGAVAIGRRLGLTPPPLVFVVVWRSVEQLLQALVLRPEKLLEPLHSAGAAAGLRNHGPNSCPAGAVCATLTACSGSQR